MSYNAIFKVRDWFKYGKVNQDMLHRGEIRIILEPPMVGLLPFSGSFDKKHQSIKYIEIMLYYTGEKENGYYVFEWR